MLKSIVNPFKILFSPEKELRKFLREILGFYPDKINLYKIAFTHRSINSHGGNAENNERLEFLGDAILDSVVADFLFTTYPGQNEGFLTKMRARIVNGETLSELATKLGIARMIKSNTNPLAKKHMYGDAFEAFIGAIYLDKGYKLTRQFIICQIIEKHIDLKTIEEVETNYKSRLLEWVQKDKKEIQFETTQEAESHNNSPVFVSYIRIGNRLAGAGMGSSKKEAEQNAARETLLKVGLLNEKPLSADSPICAN